MRIAIAPRVSSDMQAERGWSFEDQLARGHEWAEREGHTVSAIYLQPGVSAATAERDELLEIVAGAARGDFDALWIRDLMRFTRHEDDVKHLRAIEYTYGKRLFEDGRPITLLTAEGALDIGVRVQLGAYQLAQIRKLTSHGKRARATAGKRNWSVPPTGYHADGTQRADNAPAVRMIFDKFRAGIYSTREIAEMVTAAGYRTNTGRPFTADTALAILRNKWYCGFVGYRGLVPVYTEAKRSRASKRDITWTRGEHEPIISEAVWLECERLRLARSGKRAGRASKPHRVYLLQGIAVCAGCGGAMRAHSSAYERPKYRCGARDRGLPCPSEHAYLAEWKLEPQIDDQMRRLVLPEAIRRRVLEMATQADAARDVMAARSRLEGQAQRARRLFELGDYSEDEYRARRDVIAAEIAGLVVPDATDLQRALDLVNDYAAMWAGADRAQRRSILRALFDAVIVDVDLGRITEFRPKTQLAALFQAAELR
jgi:hypothetical protein